LKILLFILGILLPTIGYAQKFIHEDMLKAIQENEQNLKKGILRDDFIFVGGKKVYTGFKPTQETYYGATYLDIKVDPNVKLPKTFDMRKKSYSPVRGQIKGSCWAEGGGSAFEMTQNYKDGSKTVYAVQDIIDCSGYGTAAAGGQLSMQYATKAGLAHDKDYTYHGRDGFCKRNVARHKPLKKAPYLRGATGRFPTRTELMFTVYTYGAVEVCGSSRSLGSGGRQDEPRSGMVDHCYAVVGWLDGEEMGWLKGTYFIIKNSWGDGSNSIWNLSDGDWGDKGYGYYRLAREGEELKGSTITEIQVGDTGSPLIHSDTSSFVIETSKITQTVTILPGAPFGLEELKKALEEDLRGLK